MTEATCLQHEGVFCDEKADCIHRMSSNWFVEEPEDECNTHCHVAGSNWTNAADFGQKIWAEYSLHPPKMPFPTPMLPADDTPFLFFFNLSKIFSNFVSDSLFNRCNSVSCFMNN